MRPLLAIALSFALSALSQASLARADEPSELRLRALGAAGLMASEDQHSLLRFDEPLVEGALRAGWVVHELLVLEVGVAGGAFFSSRDATGALLDLTVGAELGFEAGGVRPHVGLHFGAGLTGALIRPVLRVTLGVDVRVSPEVALGPVIAFGHLFQENGPGFTSDASWLSLGLAFSYRPTFGGEDGVEAPAPEQPPPLRVWTTPPRPRPQVSETEIRELLDLAIGAAPRELLVPILFEYDSVDIVPCTLPALHALAEHLERHPEIESLEIEGHADGQGSDAYNDALSLRRAEAVRDWLVDRGVEPDRLSVVARGERAPVEGNDDEAGRAQNRRARFRVLRERER